MYSIYKITNNINGKIYIGFTTQNPPIKRWKNHIDESNRKNPNYHLHRSMKKYGIDNFSFEILKIGVDEEWGLKVEESYYIGMYKPEYNLTIGGDGCSGYKHTEKHKDYISNKLKGIPKSEDHRKKLSEVFKGRKISLESRRKMSLSRIGNQHLKGHIPTEKTKKLISDKLKGRKISNETIEKRKNSNSKFWEITFPDKTQEVIKNLSEFCRNNNISQGNMVLLSQGKIKSYKGYLCKKVEDNLEYKSIL